MKQREEIDHAFTALIEQSAAMLDLGRPARPFAEFRRKPARLVCDLAEVAALPRPLAPVSAPAAAEYGRLLAELRRFEPKAVLLTSLEPAQGVSFSARHLALLQAREHADSAVLLAEFYNGAGSADSGLPAQRAEDIARHPQELERFLRRCPRSGLYLLGAHAPGGGGVAGEAWTRLLATFRTIFLDCSPFWHNALAQRFAPLADGVALITCRPPDQNQIRLFQRDLQAAQARFFGVIMNAGAAADAPAAAGDRS